MVKEFDYNQHSVYLLYYYLIIVVKYRKKVIDDTISNRLCEIFINISKFINAYKSASSRLIKKEYPQITSKLWESAF